MPCPIASNPGTTHHCQDFFATFSVWLRLATKTKIGGCHDRRYHAPLDGDNVRIGPCSRIDGLGRHHDRTAQINRTHIQTLIRISPKTHHCPGGIRRSRALSLKRHRRTLRLAGSRPASAPSPAPHAGPVRGVVTSASTRIVFDAVAEFTHRERPLPATGRNARSAPVTSRHARGNLPHACRSAR